MWPSALILKMNVKNGFSSPVHVHTCWEGFIIYVFHWHTRNRFWVDDPAIRTELLEFTNLHCIGYHISTQHQFPVFSSRCLRKGTISNKRTHGGSVEYWQDRGNYVAGSMQISVNQRPQSQRMIIEAQSGLQKNLFCSKKKIYIQRQSYDLSMYINHK